MTLAEFFALPEADPIEVDRPLTGHPEVLGEDEQYVPPWRSHDGKAWWTVEGGAKRQTFRLKEDL